MLAVSLNGALGNAGLLLVLCASCIGALSTGLAIVSGNRRGVRQGPLYVADRRRRAAGGGLDAARLPARDYSLKYIQQVGSTRRRRSTTSPPCGARWRARSCCGSSSWRASRRRSRAVPQAARRRARRLGAGRDVRGVGVLRAGRVRSGQPVRVRATRSVGFDGPGPNPLLQNHPLVLFHLPILYLGYVGFTVPFAPRWRR